MSLTKQLQTVLDKRRDILKLRRLVVNPPDSIDFSSNDFLGLARSKEFRDRFMAELQAFEHPPLGSTGSRCLDGNSQYSLDLEARIAKFHHAEAALLFNSGFDANSGVFSTIPQPGDVIFYDELIHASVHEGMKLSRAGLKIPFKHNSVTDLESKIINIRSQDKSKQKARNVFVAVETVYSMDGDIPPLREMVAMLRKYWNKDENGWIIVDEAHATGVFGENGRGVVCQEGLEDDIFARVHTFGKAMASNGAVVLGTETLKNYLINYARSFIYTTFMGFSSLASINCAYQMLEQGVTKEAQLHVLALVSHFRKTIHLPHGHLLPSNSPIQGIVLDGNDKVRALAEYLKARKFNVKPILSPTVPKGTERVRICLHGDNTVDQIDALIHATHQYFRNPTKPTTVLSGPTPITASKL
ncbi:putative aminotransferase [Umbelopsis sp. PMI_123]|nr:putative aminotransferase [Umbelopsis sp. PMI_123]